jgi:uncharacterized protein YbjT (DUF2867 family)
MNLVTGATGLLGSHIAEKLVQQGQKVRALVRPGSDTRFLESLGVELAPGDVTNPGSLIEAARGVSTFYHSAARVGDWGPWEDFVAITINGTRNVIDACQISAAFPHTGIRTARVWCWMKPRRSEWTCTSGAITAGPR